MRLFKKERESLRISQARAARAVYMVNAPAEVEIRMITEDGEKLDLRFVNADMIPALVKDLIIAYEAIHPPISGSRGSYPSTWMGMS